MALSQVLLPGVVLGGEFEVIKPIGQGGMGTVYKAMQRTTGAPRAVKVMRAGLSSDPKFRARFEQEARVIARVESDHVAQVVGAGFDDGARVPWIAMELLEGETLQAWLDRGGRMSPGEVNLVLEQLCHALAAAHAVGVVHRDLKPENVFLSRPRVVGVPFMVKVLDFGVAKIISEARGVTVAVGTPAFMAPEQTSTTGEVGAQADVWALGLLVFRLLAGRSYWKALSEGQGGLVHLWREVLIDPLATASDRQRELGGEGLPAGFDGWFARCVSREIEGRYPDAGAAYQALAPLLSGGERSKGLATPPAVALPAAFGETVFAGPTPARAEGARPVTNPALVESKAPSVRVTFREKSDRMVVEAPRGSTLLEVSLANGVPHHHLCGGRARCTTCRVVLLDGAAAAGPRTEQEAAVASARRWPSAMRLACQLRVLGDMTVRRLVIDDDDRDTVNASVSSEEPVVEDGVFLAIQLHRFGDFAREQLPYDVVHVLNRFLKQLCEPALANRGSVLRYESSGVVLSFGAGELAASSIEDAVRSALRAQARVKQLNGYVLRHFGQQVGVAMGLHAGRVMRAVVGNAGQTAQVVIGEGVEGAQVAARQGAELGLGVVATAAALRLAGGSLRLGAPVELSLFGPGAEVSDFERPDVNLLVQSTFEQLEGRWPEFASTFYERLFALDPNVEPLFSHVDMQAQRSMLMEVLATAIRGLDNLEALIPTLRDLGARHVAYGARNSHYKQVGRALIESLEQFLGAAFTPEVHLAWLEVYGALAREMIEGSREATRGG